MCWMLRVVYAALDEADTVQLRLQLWVPIKKKERKEVVFGVDNRALNHIATQVQTKDLCANITSRIFIPQSSKQLHLKCSEKCKAAAQ